MVAVRKPLELSLDDALALRLAGQHLARPAPRSTLLDVLSEVCGVQAQVASAARLSLAARVEGVTDSAIEKALLEDKSLVKTWAMRGTLHLVPARDLSLYVLVGSLHRIRNLRQWLARGGVNVTKLESLSDSIVEALGEGPLTRKEIAARVGDRHGKTRAWIEQSWGGVIRQPVYQGRVCFGPTRGNEVTFVRTENWLGPGAVDTAGMSFEEAEAELTRRYLGAYGPATVRDFLYWSGFPAEPARRMWELILPETTEVSVAGTKAVVLTRALERADHSRARKTKKAKAEEGLPHVRLLPHFDVYLLGHRAKESVLGKPHYKKVFRNAGWISPVILVDGRVLGTWESERKGGTLSIGLRPFRPLDRATRKVLDQEASRLADSTGLLARVRRA